MGKRPLGIKITVLMFLMLASALLVWFFSYSLMWSLQGISIPTDDFVFDALAFSLCLAPAIGLFAKKRWGRRIALVLAVLIFFADFASVGSRSIFGPPAYSYMMWGGGSFSWYTWEISMLMAMWIMLPLPLVVFYFLLFDKATVAAFRKAPSPPTQQPRS